jgi:threonine aldolase
VITPLDELRAIREVAAEHEVPVHMDGARLWNASVASGVPLHAIAAQADTVMVAFSKGLGAPVGAALAGPAALMADAVAVRRRLGGGMRQSGVIAAAALYGVTHNRARLAEDHERAAQLARAVNGAGGARVVTPETNIVMIDLPRPAAADVAARAAALGVLLSVWTPTRLRAVTHLDVDDDAVRSAGEIVARVLEAALAA